MSSGDYGHYIQTDDRDRAIILILTDTGIRAEELCNLTMADLNMGTNALTVRGKGAGRDKKERRVYFGKTCGKALYKYLMPRLGQSGKDTSPLFLNSQAVIIGRFIVTRCIDCFKRLAYVPR